MKHLIHALLLTLIAAPSFAQGRNCLPRDAMAGILAEQYGETRRSIGIDARGRLVEVYASTQTGTWTITVTPPASATCIVASGTSFESLNEALGPQGEEM